MQVIPLDKLCRFFGSAWTYYQGRRKHLKFGGARHFEGTFFLKKKGAISKD